MHTPETPISFYLRSLAPHVPPEELKVLQDFFFTCIRLTLETPNYAASNELGKVWTNLIAEARRNGINTHPLNQTLKGIDDVRLIKLLHIKRAADVPWQKNINKLGQRAWHDIQRQISALEKTNSFDFKRMDQILDQTLEEDLMLAHQKATDALWEQLVIRSLRLNIPVQHLLELEPFVERYLTEELLARITLPDMKDCPAIAFYTSMKTIEGAILELDSPFQDKFLQSMKPLLETANTYRLLATYLRFRIKWLQTRETPCLIKES